MKKYIGLIILIITMIITIELNTNGVQAQEQSMIFEIPFESQDLTEWYREYFRVESILVNNIGDFTESEYVDTREIYTYWRLEDCEMILYLTDDSGTEKIFVRVVK